MASVGSRCIPTSRTASGALNELGIRLVTLSNGSASVAEGLFERAGIRDDFDRLLTVEDAGIWKPAPAAYAYALEQCGVDPMDAMLVAVHPWDIDGASRAGLATAWVNRTGGPYPKYFEAPDLRPESMMDLATSCADWTARPCGAVSSVRHSRNKGTVSGSPGGPPCCRQLLSP